MSGISREKMDVDLEKVRMCVAEAGYDPKFLTAVPHEDGGWQFHTHVDLIPLEVMYKAVCVGMPDEVKQCWDCWSDPMEQIVPCEHFEEMVGL